MIHLALVIIAIVVIGWGALKLLGFVISAFDEGGGCGCLALIVAVIIVIIVLAIAF